MSRRIVMLHYTPPGTIGGVEQIMDRHAALFRARGMTVDIVAGRVSTLEQPVRVIEELDVASRANAVVEHELSTGVVSLRFHALRRSIAQALAPLVETADVLIAHNAFTLHFSLPLSAALWEIAARPRPNLKVIAWTHDLSWINPLYIRAMHAGYPWNFLRVPAPGVNYVTVSQERRAELQMLWESDRIPVTVIPNGVDVAGLLRLSPRMRDLAERFQLLGDDLMLLLPVRITRRKNIELAIRAVAVLKQRGVRTRLIISGPAAPHHPGRSQSYLQELKSIRAELGLQSEVVFLSDEIGRILEDQEIAELYGLSDCLVFPSASEGFGLPILEAGLLGVPVVASRIPIFQEVGAGDVLYFSLEDEPSAIADTILDAVDTPPGRLRRRVRRDCRWDTLFDRLILPLLASGEASGTAPVTVRA